MERGDRSESRGAVKQTGHVTLEMVASEAGVSAATVSRVLSAPTHHEARRWASEKTIGRIREVAEHREFRPNPQAVALRKKTSNLLGMVVPRLQDFVLATIYEGVDEAASEFGYATVTANSLDDDSKRKRAVESFLARRVDGLILGDVPFDGDFVAWLRTRAIPFVLVSRRVEGAVSATTDDIRGGELAGAHLVESGCSRLAILAGQPYASTSLDRTAGCVSAAERRGVSIDSQRILHGPFDAQGGREATERLLDSGGEVPDGIFATNDFAAIGAMGALRERGIRVPDDVLLVGYNDTPLAGALPVPLTSIASPMHEMGQAGFDLLRQLMHGDTPESVVLSPALRVRESTRSTAL